MTSDSLFYNIDAEKHYISGVMQSKNLAEAETLLEGMTANEFYDERHKIIFSALTKLVANRKLPEMVALVDQLKKNNQADNIGGINTVMALCQLEYGTLYVAQNAGIIKELAGKRTMYTALQKALYELRNGDNTPTEMAQELEKQFADLPATMQRQDKESYMNTFAGALCFDMLDTGMTAEKNRAIPTGFDDLDRLLSGGLYAGLYVVGAISSLGKTTFCLQVADQIAAGGQDVLIFSLEMATDEIIAKSVSRLTLKNAWKNYGVGSCNTARTTREVLTTSAWKEYSQAQITVLTDSFAEYAAIGEHVKIVEGMGNVGVKEVRAAIHKHISITGNKPVVIVDYLQILAPFNERGTDKQNTDRAVLELKKMSRDYNIPVIAISSFNRENYSSPVNLAAYKEAGSVEYSADVAIALQYLGMDYQDNEAKEKRIGRIRDLFKDQIGKGARGSRQDIQLKILKNRNGVKGEMNIGFYPKYNYFEDWHKPAAGEGTTKPKPEERDDGTIVFGNY